MPKRIKNMWALLLLATRTTSQEHITARAVEQRGLSLYDVPCAETVSYTHLTLPTIYSV